MVKIGDICCNKGPRAGFIVPIKIASVLRARTVVMNYGALLLSCHCDLITVDQSLRQLTQWHSDISTAITLYPLAGIE